MFCRDKHVFVATKMILVASPANDMSLNPLPGRCSKSCGHRLRNACDESVGVLPHSQEVEGGQDDGAVDEEADDDGKEVVAHLTQQHAKVLHLHDFARDQEGDAYRRVPSGRTGM